ncbi:O-methyltransferase-domain-containing protein [Xylaria bambusicola]|uniref:O-methyltransferase-domain-containing protein n=1 Tax=Xylaria bambusicola TaxID=326684 RepID=UPI0020080A44|nr:O-methyltransferase-domain-containing protein [Xylaria bambusicola]KAI0509541.1 O-methyltransferase-domain-containing protein [Xylaria bambusicola]
MPSLTSLAEGLLARAKKLDAYLEAHNIPYPSFDEDTLDQLPNELQDERWALGNDANELKQLSRGAAHATLDCALGWSDALGLRVVYHYKLATAVPLNGSASYAEIAATSGLKEDLCRRFMRIAMGFHVFTEDPETQRVRHTASSRRLATDQSFSDAVGLEIEDLGPASSKLIDVWEKFEQNTAEPNQSAFSMFNETDKPIFALFAGQPERARRFGGAMRHFTKGDSWDLRHMLTSFDWSSIDQPGAQVVDIGGGNGQISQYLARHTTHVHYIVQDLAYVVAQAPSQLPGEFKDRIEFVEHDFFTPQTMEPPAAFLMRYVLHNWADKYAIRILQGLVPAMRKGTKVLIYEYVLEDRPVTDLTGRFGFQMDAIMATVFNAQERTAAEYEHILKETDSRYVVEAVCRPEGSTMSIVQVGWSG